METILNVSNEKICTDIHEFRESLSLRKINIMHPLLRNHMHPPHRMCKQEHKTINVKFLQMYFICPLQRGVKQEVDFVIASRHNYS